MQRPPRLPPRVKLEALAPGRRQVRVAYTRGEGVEVDLIGGVGAKERAPQSRVGAAALGAKLVGERVLRSKDLELRRKKLIVFVDFLRVDESVAAIRAREHGMRRRKRMAQADFPSLLFLPLPDRGRGAAAERTCRRSGVGDVVSRVFRPFAAPAERGNCRASKLDRVLHVVRGRVLVNRHDIAGTALVFGPIA